MFALKIFEKLDIVKKDSDIINKNTIARYFANSFFLKESF